MARPHFETLEVYQLSETLADGIWRIVLAWPRFARDTVGKQLVRAADSVGANLADGSGRQSEKDNRRFARIARGSLNEVQHWLRRAYRRQLITRTQADDLAPLIDELAPRLSADINSLGRRNVE